MSTSSLSETLARCASKYFMFASKMSLRQVKSLFTRRTSSMTWMTISAPPRAWLEAIFFYLIREMWLDDGRNSRRLSQKTQHEEEM
mmetsp:Transcript_50067/g.107767  ORF Transcript_50067/g.107767 Transcript_50067/m.107767 type:complete len:86 (-) Transcript_50067:271-528(-)